MSRAKPTPKEAKIINYDASPTARLFHKSEAFVKGIMGPFGCLAPDTLVLTELGPKPISEITHPMRVVSWNEKSGQYQLSLTGGAFPKGRDYLYRVSTRQGEFVASGHHRVLCADGIYRRVDSLFPGQHVSQCSPVQQLTNPAVVSKLPLDALHCSKTVEDCLGSYAELARQYGLQLLWDLESDQSSAPSQDDVQEYDQSCAREDGCEQARLHSRHDKSNAPHSKSHSLRQLAHRVLMKATHVSPELFSRNAGIVQQLQQSLQSCDSHRSAQLSSLCSRSYSEILQIQKELVKESYWDMQVLDTNNYVTIDGTIHHNSGKSVACCFEILLRAQKQAPGKDGIRRTRWIIARNTFGELENTTMKTWLDWFRPITIKETRKPPYTHIIGGPGWEAEIIFLALDKPEDQKKLLSFEVTGIWFNEAREIPYELVQAATGRVGRYPAKKDKPEDIEDDAWPTWRGIILDTNPSHNEHWWYKNAEEDAWAVDAEGKRIEVEDVAENNRWEFFKQPSGLSDEAENLKNLPGGKNYYTQQLGGKSENWIDVYVHGNYGYLRHGLPVYGHCWNPDTMTAKEKIVPRPGGKIYVGVDCSGRHPAAIFAQATPRGQWQILRELCVQDDEGMGAENFAKLLKGFMDRNFPNNSFEIWGDPAGDWGSQNNERTYFDILKANGVFVKAPKIVTSSRTKDQVTIRTETVMSVLNRNVDGDPALMVSPACKVLLGGFNGGYQYKKKNVAGDTASYLEEPEKNRYSDAQDALQYMFCGAGETKKMFGRNKRHGGKTTFANTKFKI